MDRWKSVVLQQLPSADELTVNQLRDELPQVLGELAQTIESSDGSHLAELEIFV